MPKVYFEKEDRTIQVEPGENLREAAIRNKFSVYAHVQKILNCRGRALCAACTVKVVAGNVAPRNDAEAKRLAKKPADFRLACQIAVEDDLVIATHPSKQSRAPSKTI